MMFLNYNVVFNDTVTINKDTMWDLDGLGYDIVAIDGNGSTICGSAGEGDFYKWMNIGNQMAFVKNLHITQFNNAIINRGVCQLDNMVFESNRMEYVLERDWGLLFLMRVFVYVIIVLLSN